MPRKVPNWLFPNFACISIILPATDVVDCRVINATHELIDKFSSLYLKKYVGYQRITHSLCIVKVSTSTIYFSLHSSSMPPLITKYFLHSNWDLWEIFQLLFFQAFLELQSNLFSSVVCIKNVIYFPVLPVSPIHCSRICSYRWLICC